MVLGKVKKAVGDSVGTIRRVLHSKDTMKMSWVKLLIKANISHKKGEKYPELTKALFYAILRKVSSFTRY